MTPDKFPYIVKSTHPEFLAAEARAKSLTEKASINEAIQVVTDLENEVATMRIADRFSKTKKPDFSVTSGVVNPSLTDLTEAEYKRQTLLNALHEMKNQLSTLTGGIEDIVMDIEATKTD